MVGAEQAPERRVRLVGQKADRDAHGDRPGRRREGEEGVDHHTHKVAYSPTLVNARSRSAMTSRGSSRPMLIRSRPSSTPMRSEEHTSELQSLMRISYAVFCLKKKTREK